MLGKAGELRVASELLLKGFGLYLATVDSGVDIILENGKRIQVKSARRTIKKNFNSYTFSFKSWKSRIGHHIAHPLDDVDFLILWAVNDDCFFIIPVQEIRGKYSVQLGLTGREWSHYVKYKNNWDSLLG